MIELGPETKRWICERVMVELDQLIGATFNSRGFSEPRDKFEQMLGGCRHRVRVLTELTGDPMDDLMARLELGEKQYEQIRKAVEAQKAQKEGKSDEATETPEALGSDPEPGQQG